MSLKEDWGDWIEDLEYQGLVAEEGMEFVTSRKEWVRGRIKLLWSFGPF